MKQFIPDSPFTFVGGDGETLIKSFITGPPNLKSGIRHGNCSVLHAKKLNNFQIFEV